MSKYDIEFIINEIKKDFEMDFGLIGEVELRAILKKLSDNRVIKVNKD